MSSERHSSVQIDELGDIFVSVTGDDSVTERQEETSSDREVPDQDLEVEDGLDDAVAGAELGGDGDPAA